MAFKKDTKIKNNFTKITISLASPDEILENSHSVPSRTMSAIAVSTSASVTRVSSVTTAVLR